jgi:hypothetical protein
VFLLPQSLPPRALAASADAPRGGGSSWSRAHSILQLCAEVKQGCDLSALTGAQHLLAYPSRRSHHDGPQPALVGGHQQAGQCALKRAGGLDGAHGLNGTDESLAFAYDVVGFNVTSAPAEHRTLVRDGVQRFRMWSDLNSWLPVKHPGQEQNYTKEE